MKNDSANPWTLASGVSATDAVLRALASSTTRDDVADVVSSISRELGFRHFALLRHEDLHDTQPIRVDIRDYPIGIAERLLFQGWWRRDPIFRACIFAEHAFLWSDLPRIIDMNRRDHECLALGRREGLNQGITIPCVTLGNCTGSCTFAGIPNPERAEQFLGICQMIGVFAFQAAKRVSGDAARIGPRPRLHPRPRDCVVLAGRGYSNKEIARALALAPRTVDAYLTEARRLFDAHDRTELVVSAVLAGEISLAELRPRQPG